MQLPASVRHEEVCPPVEAVVGRGDSHARVGVGGTLPARPLTEPEIEVARTCFPYTSDPVVQVEPVRVEVVGDVEVEASVPVDVGEHRPQAVVDRCTLQPGSAAHLPERRAAVVTRPLVEIEAVGDGEMVGREPFRRSRSLAVRVGVARHEQVGEPVAVHVAHRRTRMPARIVDPGGLVRLP